MHKKGKSALAYLMVLIAMAFVALTLAIVLMPLPDLDKNVSKAVQSFQSPALYKVMLLVSDFGVMPFSVLMVLITALVFFLFKYKREALFVLFTLFCGVASTLIKYLVDRPRPAAPFVQVMEKTRQQSFPSGHVNFYVLFFGFILVLMFHMNSIPKLVRMVVGGFSAGMILLVPYSRIYLGAHWFTDVLGGILLGSLLLYVNSYYYLRKK